MILNMKRRDIQIGIMASAIAVLGLASSILSGNEDLILPSIFGQAAINQQKPLFIFALLVAGMTGLKWWQAKRNGDL
jgi:hypothetical protein